MKDLSLHKLCPKCNKDIYYSRKDSLNRAIEENRVCHQCRGGWKFSDEIKKKYSISKLGSKNPMFGKTHSDEHKEKLSKKSKGRKDTDEVKEKKRISTLKRIKKQGREISFNPKACEFIDKLNKERGWNLHHALNGGEYQVIGYSLDGYDKERNIIFEYDESYHNKKSIKEKDILRQKRLIGKLKPTMFLRYNEKDKMMFNVSL